MKPNRTRSRKPAVIPNSRWLAYATAGAASTFACASTAEAGIHYSGHINHDFAQGGFTGPLGPGVTLQLNVGTGTQVGNNYGFGQIRIYSQSLCSLGAFVGTEFRYAGFYLLELPVRASLPAQNIGNSCRFSSSCRCQGCQVCYGGIVGGSGRFRDRSIGFIGFAFNRGAGTQYGWVRVKKSGAPDYHFHLLDYAFGDPGDPLYTGQRRGPCAATPCPPAEEPEATPKEGSLGWLALGAVGLLAWRKTRSRASR